MKISPSGLFDFLLATAVTSVIGATFLTVKPAGYPYWVGGITLIYLFAARLALSIHALNFDNGRFTGKPVVGKPADFSLSDIKDYFPENLSRPPRARIILRNGKTVLIKKPWWSKAVSRGEFEKEVRVKAGEI